MANVFKPKRSSTASSVPTTSNLADGELAVNSADQKIYLREGSNIVEVGNTSSGISSVVEDTTPQLGGTLETNGNLIDFGDSSSTTDDRLRFGANQELQIFYNPDNGNSIIQENGSGNLVLNADNLIIRNSSANENKAKFVTNGSAILYHNAIEKFRTTSIGASVSGTLEVGAGVTIYGNSGIVSATSFYGDGSNLTGLSGGISNVSEDTTPTLGGTLETNGNLIDFGDSSGATDDRLRFGAGQDLQIWHNGANSYIAQQSDVGDLYLTSSNDDNDVVIQTDNGSGSTTDYFRADGSTGEAKLFYYGSEKIKTVNTGVTITGTASATEFSGGGSNLTGLTGASAATYGDSGSTPVITVDANGRITGITTAAVSSGGGTMSDLVDDTTPQLGGNLDVNGKNINFGNSASASDDRLNFGGGTDLSIYHDGTNSYIDVIPDSTNHLYIRNNVDSDEGGDIRIQAKSGENSIVCLDDAGVYLYYDNSSKFETTSTGFTVTGTGLGNFKSNDNSTLTAGTGDDFQIYHNGSNTYLDNDTGHLYIRNNVDGDVGGDIRLMPHDNENGIIIYDDSGVELYCDNSVKLTTTSTGFSVTGTGLGNFKANDNSTLTVGTGDDFQIYHDGSDTYLDNDTRHLFIRNNVAGDVGGNIYIRPHDNENGIVVVHDAGVHLYHNNVEKLSTTSDGVTIDGTLGVTTLTFADNKTLTFGNSEDLSIYHDGSDTYLDNDTRHLFIRNNVAGDDGGNIYIRPHDNENGIIVVHDGGVALYYDNSSKFETTDTGFTVTGTGLGNFKSNDNSTLTAGTGDDFQIYHNGSHTYLDNDTGHLYIRNNVAGDVGGDIRLMPHDNENGIIIYDDSGVELYCDNSVKLTTTSTGFSVTGTGLGNFKANDNSYLTAGTGDDFQIYHNGSNTYLDNDTGHLYIRNNVGGDVGGDIRLMPHDNENGIIIYDDAGVELYYDNSVKLTTTSTGVSVTGTLSTDEFSFGDNKTITFGASSDLSIYHGVSNNIGHSYIDNDTGHLYIRNNVGGDVGGDIRLMPHDNENGIIIYDDSGVELYCDNSVKLTTTSTGFSVTGTGLGNFKANDNSYLTAGTGDDFQIYHNGSHTYLDNDTGHLYIRNNVGGDVGGDIRLMPHDNENGIIIYDDSGVELYCDNSVKLTTTDTGFTVTGTGLGNFKSNDNSTLTAGTGDDFQIYHNGSHTYLDNDTGHLYIRNNVASDVGGNIYLKPHDDENGIIVTHDGPVELYHNNSLKLTTSSTGITVTGTGVGDGWKVNDSEYFTAGTGDDLQIYHTGSHAFLDNDTGHLYIRNNVDGDVGGNIFIRPHDDEEGIVIINDGAVRLYYDNSTKFETTGIGVSIVGTGNTATIAGPSELVLDPGTVGDNTGKVVILGNLQVDGTQTVINSTTLTVDDKSIVLASGAADSSAANGAGIEVDGASATFQYAHSGTKWVANKDLQAEAFIKNGGTSSQFLKADGSVDSSTYLTGSGNVNIAGIATATNIVSVKSDDGTPGRVDLYCESNNAHYARIVAPAHSNFSGNITLTLPNSTGTLLNSDGSGASLTGLTGASAATYGDSGSFPIIVVDANGRITGISTAAAPSSITRTATRIVATNGQTAFTVATYDSTLIDVYLNGVKLDSTEYATTNSTTITLTTGASTGDIFESVSYTNFSGTSVSSVTVADESSDTTCFPLFATAATGDVEPKSGSNLTFDSASGILGATTFQGNLDLAGLLKEGVNIVNGKLSANTNIDLANGMVHFFDTTETTTSTPNIRVDASTTLNSSMNVGEAITVVLISSAAAAGYSAQLTIDGAAVTERWLGGSAPTAGGSSGLDVYTYTIIKVTSSPVYSVLANVVNFA